MDGTTHHYALKISRQTHDLPYIQSEAPKPKEKICFTLVCQLCRWGQGRRRCEKQSSILRRQLQLILKLSYGVECEHAASLLNKLVFFLFQQYLAVITFRIDSDGITVSGRYPRLLTDANLILEQVLQIKLMQNLMSYFCLQAFTESFPRLLPQTKILCWEELCIPSLLANVDLYFEKEKHIFRTGTSPQNFKHVMKLPYIASKHFLHN